MVRNYRDQPLGPGVLDGLLAQALRGPSAGFAQGFDLLALEGPDQTGRFWRASQAIDASRERWAGIMNAPALIVFLANEQVYRDRYGEPDKSAPVQIPWWFVDTAFAAMITLLGAVDKGLGALFFGVNDPVGLRREFHIPESFVPIGAIAVGHAADDRPSASLARARRPTSDSVHLGDW